MLSTERLGRETCLNAVWVGFLKLPQDILCSLQAPA